MKHAVSPTARSGPGRTRRARRRAARDARGHSAQVLLRRARLRALRRDLRAARVLPDAHRAGDLRRAPRRDRRGRRPRRAVRRPRRRRLRARRGRGSPFLAPARYVAVDIAGDAHRARRWRAWRREFPALDDARRRHRLHARASTSRRDLAAGARRRSSTPARRSATSRRPTRSRFLRARPSPLLAPHAGSGLLIGVDTKKDPARLDAAYDDAVGVTAAFNRNVLRHVNRAAGQRLPAGGVRARRVLRRRRRGASRCTSRRRRADGGDRRRDAPLRGRRAHPHRELVQVRAGRVRALLHARGLPPRALLAGPRRRLRGVLRRLTRSRPAGPRSTVRRGRAGCRRTASARPAGRSCGSVARTCDARRRARAAAQHELVAHELAVVLADARRRPAR